MQARRNTGKCKEVSAWLKYISQAKASRASTRIVGRFLTLIRPEALTTTEFRKYGSQMAAETYIPRSNKLFTSAQNSVGKAPRGQTPTLVTYKGTCLHLLSSFLYPSISPPSCPSPLSAFPLGSAPRHVCLPLLTRVLYHFHVCFFTSSSFSFYGLLQYFLSFGIFLTFRFASSLVLFFFFSSFLLHCLLFFTFLFTSVFSFIFILLLPHIPSFSFLSVCLLLSTSSKPPALSS